LGGLGSVGSGREEMGGLSLCSSASKMLWGEKLNLYSLACDCVAKVRDS
jgi:hypothetical protein